MKVYYKKIFLTIIAIIMPFIAFSLELSEASIHRGLRSGTHQISITQLIESNFDSTILLIAGPTASATIWKKEKKFGLWLNRRSFNIPYYNSVSHVYSSAPLEEITSAYNISLLNLDKLSYKAGNELYQAFLKEQFDNDLFHREITDFVLAGNILSKEVILPTNIPTGEYKVYLYLFQDKNLISAAQSKFTVKDKGLLYKINRLAVAYPLLYSLLAIIIALGLGAQAAYLVPLLRKARTNKKR